MVTKDTGPLPGDVQYPAPTGFENLPGLEEAARKLYDAGATLAGGPPALNLVASTENAPKLFDVSTEALSLLSEIATLPPAAQGRLGPEIAALQAAVRGSSATISLNSEAIRAAIDQAREYAEAIAARNETPEQKAERLWQEIGELQKEVKTKVDKAYARGDVDEKDYKEWQTLSEEIAAMPEGEARTEAMRKKTEMEKGIFKTATEKAQDDGRASDVEEYKKGTKETEEVTQKLLLYREDYMVKNKHNAAAIPAMNSQDVLLPNSVSLSTESANNLTLPSKAGEKKHNSLG